ncbi:ER-golgi trafficking TRAPP I complex 85 kDa subunit-domain-containing protein [Phanerochaete sordida]|uniref:ER-golgi trafficking TRAPP I complex 85 kDa subunit-domain-containing protein n=1 Tax=Phanerochaete sordida TaxID=48140 RepID=A0A9P3G3K6_9APHY|nr:ER-golgi trafficking TRAPP I complex 85 kDa subunit-domain-containing protein [Phanerochaete sordida]
MAPTLPSSLSPHICILQSPDVQQLLADASLPPLSQVLQSFTPLSQVSTRTTTLSSVTHASFALRFSELPDVEASLHEDEEQRAGRTLDWIGSRVAARSARWVELVEKRGRDDGAWRTPWWDEVRRCVEGDLVPSRYEGWNHPTAVIYAVSTIASNPLQALQDLLTRPVDFPPWVDRTFLRYFLIIHPANSPLSDPITESLFNAVKKQYGLHTHLLQVGFPTMPQPQPVQVPLPIPRLPPLSTMEASPMPPSQMPSGLAASPMPTPSIQPRSPDPSATNPDGSQLPAAGPGTLVLSQDDIQIVARFIREFATMSLIPWMEKCVLEWNETYSSSRRLPSRLFSSTRRLFGSSAASASAPGTPTHGSTASISSGASRFGAHAPSSSVTSLASVASLSGASEGFVTQQRRLAEFATILGDYKLAISVWEALRKDSKGGSDILPLLVAPSPALALHASTAIALLQTTAADKPALAQLRALTHAVRWEIGIDMREFLGPTLEGERWLVQAAGAAEEPPTALLLAHAAFLTSKKGALRRAALWYLCSADRLEKAGIKPLALYLFRQSHELYCQPPDKALSPSFWESEDRSVSQWKGFDAVLPGIEHELGRLLYTTGDTEGAVRYFVGLLRDPGPQVTPPQGLGLVNDDSTAPGRGASTDRVYLEDFRVALKHFKTIEQDRFNSTVLELPVRFSQPRETRLRLPGNATDGDPQRWEQLEEQWATFWRPRGKERLQPTGKAAVHDPFWIDVVLRNPLNVEVTLADLTVVVQDASAEGQTSTPDFVEVETIDDLVLGARESRTIPVAVKCSRPATLVATHVKFSFLSLLPVTESLAVRGRRLHDTPHQRQNKVYAPDVLIKTEVEDSGYRLQTTFIDGRHLSLYQGERRRVDVRLHNSGSRSISELWLVSDTAAQLWIDHSAAPSEDAAQSTETFQSANSLAAPEPYLVDLTHVDSASKLEPGQEVQLPLLLYAARTGEHDLSLLMVYREVGDDTFHSARLTRHYDVQHVLHIETLAKAGLSPSDFYSVKLQITNVASNTVRLTQVTFVSHIWDCSPLSTSSSRVVLPSQQSTRVSAVVGRSSDESDADDIARFVSAQVRRVVLGDVPSQDNPPTITLRFKHLSNGDRIHPVNVPSTRHFVEQTRRAMATAAVSASHPYIPSHLHRQIFPIYNPGFVDFLIFWEFPSQGRSGHCLVSGLRLGATHAPLREIIEEAENAKEKRSMYAETQRQRLEMLEAVRNSEWNAEIDPMVVVSHDGQEVKHDFSAGPCQVPVTFTLRNVSLTHPLKYTFKLPAVPTSSPPNPNRLPPQYSGRLTHRGQLAASQVCTVRTKMTVDRPGCYALTSWSVETEVGEPSEDDSAQWKVRQRYQQQAPASDSSSVTVIDISRP